MAGRLGLTFLEYRALEAGKLWISFDLYERIVDHWSDSPLESAALMGYCRERTASLVQTEKFLTLAGSPARPDLRPSGRDRLDAQTSAEVDHQGVLVDPLGPPSRVRVVLGLAGLDVHDVDPVTPVVGELGSVR